MSDTEALNMDRAVEPPFGIGCHVTGGQGQARSHNYLKKNCVIKKKSLKNLFFGKENVIYCQMPIVHADLMEWVGKAPMK